MTKPATAINSQRRSATAVSEVCINPIGLSAGIHQHRYHQLLFGIQGETQCAFGHTENIINVSRCCAVPAGQRHAYEGNSRNSNILVINIDRAGRLSTLLNTSAENSVLERLFDHEQFIPANLQLGNQVQALAQTLLSPTPNPLLQMHQLTGLLLNLEANLIGDTKTGGKPSKLALHKINQLIDAHLHLPLSVGDMAHHLRMSESYFYAVFLQEFGQSPHQYALSRRLNRAKGMMLHSDLTLTDIAHEIGFSSSSAFSRAFKKQFGQTPSECQRKGRGAFH